MIIFFIKAWVQQAPSYYKHDYWLFVSWVIRNSLWDLKMYINRISGAFSVYWSIMMALMFLYYRTIHVLTLVAIWILQGMSVYVHILLKSSKSCTKPAIYVISSQKNSHSKQINHLHLCNNRSILPSKWRGRWSFTPRNLCRITAAIWNNGMYIKHNAFQQSHSSSQAVPHSSPCTSVVPLDHRPCFHSGPGVLQK